MKIQRYLKTQRCSNGTIINCAAIDRVYRRSRHQCNPEKTLKNGLKVLRSTLNCFEDNIPWWIAEGTALGFCRDNDFIPHDEDIDVHLLLPVDDTSNDIFLETLLRLMEIQFRLIRRVYHDDLITQLAFIDSENNFIFDYLIFYSGMIEGQYRNWNEEGYQDMPASMVDNRKEIDTPYGPLMAPYPLDVYCKYRYGDTWKIPISGEQGKPSIRKTEDSRQ